MAPRSPQRRGKRISSLVKDVAPTWIFALLYDSSEKKDLVARGEDGAGDLQAIDRDLTLMALEAAKALDSRRSSST